MTLLSPVPGVPIIGFIAITKNGASSRLYSIIVAMLSAWRGKWNKHAVAPFDNFFYAGAIFLIFVKKCRK